jgi:hypothetical protein
MQPVLTMSARQSAKRNWNMKQVRRSLKQGMAARSYRNWSGLSRSAFSSFKLRDRPGLGQPKVFRTVLYESAMSENHGFYPLIRWYLINKIMTGNKGLL